MSTVTAWAALTSVCFYECGAQCKVAGSYFFGDMQRCLVKMLSLLLSSDQTSRETSRLRFALLPLRSRHAEHRRHT